jgi:hypothetical protein
VHGVEDVALLGVGDGEHALHAEEVVALLAHQLVDPVLQQLEVELTLTHLPRVVRAPTGVVG